VAPNAGGASYTAPAEPMGCTVTVASAIDPSNSATAQVKVRGERLVSAVDDTDDGACTWTRCSLREALIAATLSPALIRSCSAPLRRARCRRVDERAGPGPGQEERPAAA